MPQVQWGRPKADISHDLLLASRAYQWNLLTSETLKVAPELLSLDQQPWGFRESSHQAERPGRRRCQELGKPIREQAEPVIRPTDMGQPRGSGTLQEGVQAWVCVPIDQPSLCLRLRK